MPRTPSTPVRPADLTGDHYRITPLTSRVVRLEYSPSGSFEDRPSTFAVNRELQLAPEEYELGEYEGRLVLSTSFFRLEYDRGPFSANGLKVEVKGGVSSYHSVWRFGQDLSLPADRQRAREGKTVRSLDGNMGGAARTLDVADGAIPMEPGVISHVGYAVIDDSASMVFDPTGHLSARRAEPGSLDLYVFAGGLDHVGTIRDFYALSGPQPLLPKFALGNWWSRYYRYTESEYLQLMDAFKREDIPLAVAVIDMDWHLTDIDPKYGSGWTGYTWNRELFPNPERFLAALHERGLAVTLNVHPADGVRAFEESYIDMCARMGLPADGRALPFDVNNREFMDAYFEVLHRRLENQGVDFWWIDWQSGPYSSVEGVDPLWVLNHEHFTRSARNCARPLTFSRYAGPGSHRYPVGFSGDTITTWDSLHFQPEFTAAGANIGYGWWSHDIGGHMEGYRDNELATRWLQFGVFSPITRLHSSNSRFSGKEPWKYPAPHGEIQAAYLRLRHRMLPYLHAMNYRAHHKGRALVEPTYYRDHDHAAYIHRNQYFFGSEILVSPVTQPAVKGLGRARTEVYFPPGQWFDLFTETRYRGGVVQRVYRDLETMPVFIRAGGILPLAAPGCELAHVEENPLVIDVIVAAAAHGEFVLHEEWEGGQWSHTRLTVDPDAGEFRILIPDSTPEVARAALTERTWNIVLLGHDPYAFGDVEVAGAHLGEFTKPQARAGAPVMRISRPVAAETPAPYSARFSVTGVSSGTEAVVRSEGFGTVFADTAAGAADAVEKVIDLVDRAEIGIGVKEAVLRKVHEGPLVLLRSLTALASEPNGHLPEVRDYDVPSPDLIAAITELCG